MADAYRGLTIRIGGDTTKLTAALRAASKAAQQTQSQLKAVTKSMRFDPSDITAASLKLRLMEERGESLASQLKTTRDAYRALGSTTAEGTTKSVRKLSEETGNAALAAQRALDRYNLVDGELENIYAAINKAARANDAFGKSFDLREEDDIEATADALAELGIITQGTADELKRLRGVWADAFNSNEAAKQVQTFRELEVKANGLENEITAVNREMAEMRAPSNISTQLDEQRASVRKLDAAIADLEADVRRCDDALELDPSNVAAAERRMGDLASASKLASDKARLLNEQLAAYSGKGVAELASDMGRVSIEAAKANEQYAKTSALLSTAKGELEELRAQQQRMKDSGNELSADYRQLSDAIDRASSEVGELESAERAANERREHAAMASEYAKLGSEVMETESKIKSLNAAMQKVEQTSEDTAAAARGIRDRMGGLGDIGSSLSAVLTPAMQQLASAGMESAANIDAAYRDMRKTVQGSETDFENLKQSALDFSSQNFTSAEQILQIQAIGGELGIATDNLKVFSETVANLEIATNLGADEAATALGTMSNIMNDIDATTMPRFADALVRLGNNGASTEVQIVEIAKRIGSMGSIVGMTTPQILAWASTIASTGQKSEAAGTAISRTMSDIETAVANGGDSLQKFADIAGMSADEFTNMWKTSPSDALKAFIEGLNRIEGEGGSAVQKLQELGIEYVRQKQGIQGLMQSIGGLNDNLAMSNDAWNGVTDQWGAAGDAAREAEAKNEGLSGSLARLANNAKNVGAEVGDAIAPAVDNLADGAADLAKAFAGTDDSFKVFVASLVAGGMAIGPAIIAAKGLKKAYGSVLDIFSTGKDVLTNAMSKMSQFACSMSEAGGAVKYLKSGFGGLLTTGKLLATSMAALKLGAVALTVGGIAAMVAQSEEAKRKQEELAESLRTSDEIMGEAKGAAGQLAGSIGEIAPDVDGVVESMRKLNEEAGELLTETFTKTASVDGYVATISELMNQTGLTATQQEKLKLAVDGYNEATGENMSVQDAVNGKIQDSNGKLLENTNQLKANADAWKRNAEAQAYSRIAGDYFEAQIKAAHELELANDKLAQSQKNYEDAQKRLASAESGSAEWMQASKDVDRYGAEIRGTAEDIETLAAESQNAKDSYRDFTTEAAIATSEFSEDVKANLNSLPPEWQAFALDVAANLQQTGQSVGTFEQNLAAMGLSIDAVRAIGEANFASLYEACNGNLELMKWSIANYNTVPLIDKNGNVDVNDASLIDAQGNVWTWNGTTFIDQYGNVIVNDQQLQDAQGRLYEWDGTKLIPQEADATVEHQSVIDAKDAVDKLNNTDLKNKDKHAKVEYKTVAQARQAIRNYMSEPFTDRTRTLTIKTHKITVQSTTPTVPNPSNLDTFAARRMSAPMAASVLAATRGVAARASEAANVDGYAARADGGRIEERTETRRAARRRHDEDYRQAAIEAAGLILAQLPEIIENHTPVMGSREFGRVVRKAVL